LATTVSISIDRLPPLHSPRPAKNFPNTSALPVKVLASRLWTGHRPDNVLGKQGGHVTGSEAGVALADQCGVGVLGP
jgi:hypothetical protein